MMAFSMSWRVEHLYNASHAWSCIHMETSAPVHRMCSNAGKYKDAIDVFDSYENMNTEDMTHQRQSKGKADATVKVAANMHDHHNEEGPVFVQPNK